MAIGNLNVGSYEVVSATGNIRAGSGAMLGIFASASSSGIIAIYDSATTTTTSPMVSQFTLVAGTWYNLPLTFADGLYIVLVSGTASFTVAVV
jgi:hypothetical protein